MEMVMDYRKSYIQVTVNGKYDLNEVKRIFDIILDNAMERRISKILIDARNLSGTLTTMERYDIGEYLAKINFDFYQMPDTPPLRLACVAVEPPMEPSRFVQTVARNRGVDIMITDTMAEALKWLGAENTSEKGF